MNKYNIFDSLDRADSICIISHKDPDVDALTSLVLLKDFFKRTLHIKTIDIYSDYTNFPEVYKPITKRYNLNPKIETNYDIAISVDSPSVERLGKFSYLFNNSKSTIVIDHHTTNYNFGQINLVEPASSTCEIIHKVLSAYNHKFSKQNYGMIYAGIITDTNNFTVGNLNPDTYAVAGECVAHIDPRPIFKQFMNNHTLKNMQLLSIAINNITTHFDERVIISYISQSDAARYQAKEEDYLGIVNRIAAISNCDLVCLIYPKDDSYYVSMRASEGFSVSEVAKKFGGGGHHGAAAFISNKAPNEIREEVLVEFSKIINSSIDKHNFKF